MDDEVAAIRRRIWGLDADELRDIITALAVEHPDDADRVIRAVAGT